mgnify:CR=1 FL=1
MPRTQLNLIRVEHLDGVTVALVGLFAHELKQRAADRNGGCSVPAPTNNEGRKFQLQIGH